MITKLSQSRFGSGKNCRPQGRKMIKFSSFRDERKSLPKTSISSVTIIARANPQKAFERKLNSPSQHCRQIRPEVNGLAFRLQRSRKVKIAIFERHMYS